MPQAIVTHTVNPSSVAIAIALASSPDEARPVASGVPGANRTLARTCRDALVTHRAMTALATSVAALPPDDPRHAAAHDAAALLLPDWQAQVGRVCAMPGENEQALQLKARLLSTLFDRDEADLVIGGPVLSLAASLVDDVLVRTWSDAG